MMLLECMIPPSKNEKAIRYMELPSIKDKEHYPILVTSLKSLYWLTKPPKASTFKLGFQIKNKDQLLFELVKEIAFMSSKANWGNLIPKKGDWESKAKDYLTYYGVSEIERIEEPWLPTGWTVFVPKERSLLGVFGESGTQVCAVIHNPSRAITICAP